MRVESLEMWRIDLELRHQLATSGGTHARRPVILVRIETDLGEGTGECEALEAPTYTEEYTDGAWALIANELAPRLIALDHVDDAAGAMRALSVVRGHPMAKAALEMALIDAELRATGEGLAAHLGATAPSVPAGANVGIGTAEEVLRSTGAAVEAGYRRVKVKIAPGHELAPLAAVREAYPDLVLSADANGAYDPGDPAHRELLHGLDELGLAALEQPFAPERLVELAALCDELATPVVLDESITSPASLEIALALGTLDAVSVKPARLGGIAAAVAVHDRCVARGVALSIGGMLESGLGRAAALCVAALPGFTMPGDLGASDRYFVPDLTAPHLLVDGALEVPRGSGIGREVDWSALRGRARRWRVTRS
jgi:o-succinylbenzoate synthase